MSEYQRQVTSTVEEAPNWGGKKYTNAELAPDAASYHIYTPPHDYRRLQ